MGARVKKQLFLLLSIIILLSSISIINAVTTVEITGAQGIPGIRGVDDVTKVHVVSDGEVSIIKGAQEYPMNCVGDEEGIFVCDHTFEQSTTEMGEYVLTFKQGANQFTWPFIVDGKKPTITKLLVKPEGDKLNLSLTIYDESFLGSENCSGIQSIEVTTEEDTFYTEKIPTTKVCTYEKSIIINPPKISGELTFTAIVQDYLGQIGNLTFGPINVDFQRPEIQDEVNILSADKKLEVISAQPTMVPSAEVHIKVKEDNLSSVTGNLSALSRNPDLKTQDSNRQATCSKQGLMYDCVFKDVQINPGATEVPIKITATDSKGHKATKNILAHFTVQTKMSEVTYFGRDEKENCFEGTCYYKGGANKIFMHITSQDVDIKPYLITVMASGLSSVDHIKMSSCNDTGDYYNCYGYLPVDKSIPSGSKQTITLTTPSTDSLGSSLKGISSTLVVVDQDPPVAKTDINSSVLCPITGEKDYITINVTDEISPIIRISANPKKITTENSFQNDCQRQGNIFVCKLELNKFVSYAENEDLAVTVEDLAGNKIKDLTIPMQVCEAETQVPPESLSSITSDPTQKIDKRMMTFMPIRAYLPLKFNFKNQNAGIVDLDTDGCFGTDNLAGRPYFINKHFSDQKHYQPILVVPIGGQKKLLDSSVIINCTIKVYEKRDVVRYTKPELEKLVVSMPIFNQELGTIDVATQDKLDNLIVEINDLQHNIDNWNKYLGILDKLCTASKTLNTVFSTVSSIESVIYAAAVSFQWVEGVPKMWRNLCMNVFENVNKLRASLNPVGFLTKLSGVDKGGSGSQKLNIGMSSFLKLGCLTYNCGLCSPEGVLQAVNIVGSGLSQINGIDKQKALDGHEVDKQTAEKKLEDLSKEKESLSKEKGELLKEQKNEETTSDRKDEIKKRLDDIKTREGQIEKSEKMWEGKKETAEGFENNANKVLSEIASKELKGTTINPLSITSDETLNEQIQVQKTAIQEAVEQINTFKSKDKLDRTHYFTGFEQKTVTTKKLVPGEPGNSFNYGSINIEINPPIGHVETSSTTENVATYGSRKEHRTNLNIQEDALFTAKSNLYALENIKNYNYVDEEESAFLKRQQEIENAGVVERLDPFENIHFAQGCLCGPGIVYAKEKLKQLNCRRYKCIEENAKNGLPITSCDIDFDQGKCMYFDGPKSNMGFWNDFFGNVWRNYFYGEVGEKGSSSGFSIASKSLLTTRKILCAGEYTSIRIDKVTDLFNKLGSISPVDNCNLVSGFRSVTCSVTGAALSILNFKSYFQNPWQPGLRELKGEDYCANIPLEVAEK